jgi:hypothetical protein
VSPRFLLLSSGVMAEQREAMCRKRGTSNGEALAEDQLNNLPVLPADKHAGFVGAQPMRGGHGGCPPSPFYPGAGAEQLDRACPEPSRRDAQQSRQAR